MTSMSFKVMEYLTIDLSIDALMTVMTTASVYGSLEELFFKTSSHDWLV
jgi:hypothetical protein